MTAPWHIQWLDILCEPFVNIPPGWRLDQTACHEGGQWRASYWKRDDGLRLTCGVTITEGVFTTTLTQGSVEGTGSSRSTSFATWKALIRFRRAGGVL